MLDGIKPSETQVTKFSDFLKQESNSLVQNIESPKSVETNSHSIQKLEVYQPLSNVSKEESNKDNEDLEIKSESNLDNNEIENHDDVSTLEEEEVEEKFDNLHFYGTEFFNNIQSFQNLKNEKHKLESEGKNDRVGLPFAMIKSNDKLYAGQTKEATNFIDDAKKIAESFFKKEKREIKPNHTEIQPPKREDSGKGIDTSLHFNNHKIEMRKENVIYGDFAKIKQKNEKSDKDTSKNKINISTNSIDINKQEHQNRDVQEQRQTFSNNSKVVSFEAEIPSRKKSLAKVNDKQESNNNSNIDSIVTNEKMIRSLGVKDREFAKLDQKQSPSNEKPKSKDEAILVNSISLTQGQQKEESSAGSGNKNQSSNRDGFSFAGESKISNRNTENVKLEKSNLPSKQDLQKNLDDLVKQARFDIVQNGKSTAEIIMNPKEYGRLSLRVTVDGEKVEGRLIVDSEEMKALLTSEIAKLTENLKESGLTLESLLVDVWDNTGSTLADKKFNQHSFAEEIETNSISREISEDDSESNPEPRSEVKSRGLEVFA